MNANILLVKFTVELFLVRIFFRIQTLPKVYRSGVHQCTEFSHGKQEVQGYSKLFSEREGLAIKKVRLNQVKILREFRCHRIFKYLRQNKMKLKGRGEKSVLQN